MQARPLTYLVRVRWQEVASADPNGLFNLRIRPWDSSYQTNDIWVDSEANAFGVYETALEPVTGNPLGNGDRPWVDHLNRIEARISNFGIVDASDVQATIYVNSPPAIGDRGTWVPLAVQTVPTIAAGSSAVVQASWFPVRGEHTCIKVEIESQTGETEVNDNGAQENVSVFNTEGASPHEPIVLDVRLQNPLTRWAKLELAARGLLGMGAGSREQMGLASAPRREGRACALHGPRTGPATDRGSPKPDDIRADVTCFVEAGEYRWYGEGPNVEGLAEHLASIGGVQLSAHARRRALLRIAVDPVIGGFTATGAVVPSMAGRRITVELTEPEGRATARTTVTDTSGSFRITGDVFRPFLPAGAYRIQAFLVGDDQLSDAESALVAFDIDEVDIG